jgi:hypothetical protein
MSRFAAVCVVALTVAWLACVACRPPKPHRAFAEGASSAALWVLCVFALNLANPALSSAAVSLLRDSTAFFLLTLGTSRAASTHYKSLLVTKLRFAARMGVFAVGWTCVELCACAVPLRSFASGPVAAALESPSPTAAAALVVLRASAVAALAVAQFLRARSSSLWVVAPLLHEAGRHVTAAALFPLLSPAAADGGPAPLAASLPGGPLALVQAQTVLVVTAALTHFSWGQGRFPSSMRPSSARPPAAAAASPAAGTAPTGTVPDGASGAGRVLVVAE